MSDAGDDIQVDAPVEEVAAEAPKGKLSVEEALQVHSILLSTDALTEFRSSKS